jgi:dolichyl-phosphate beta-glucosyltransferase
MDSTPRHPQDCLGQGSAAADLRGVVLVVPCHNEESRLDPPAFRAWLDRGISLVFVDGGSTDGTARVLSSAFGTSPGASLLRIDGAGGKGEAVRRGMLEGLRLHADAGWFGFWDADLSAPPDQIDVLLETGARRGAGCDAVWATRRRRPGADIRRPLLRRMISRSFSLAARLLLGVRFPDTQCGAKLFRRQVVSRVFSAPFVTDWIFDLELYFRCGRERIAESPLSRWQDDGASRIRWISAFGRLPGQFLALHRLYRRPSS